LVAIATNVMGRQLMSTLRAQGEAAHHGEGRDDERNQSTDQARA
jgi:hypothetical protein